MVRLKHTKKLNLEKLSLIKSQFHYGSIKTYRKGVVKQNDKINLNSTMVRLKLIWIEDERVLDSLISIPLWFD